MDYIKFTFKTSECNGWPMVRVLIDGDLYEDHHFTSEHEEITVPIELLDGDHKISIELYGKLSRHTLIDHEGKIVKDQVVELLDIYVNDIKLPEWFTYLGNYEFNNMVYPQAKMWGCNGVWSWVFATPLITWVLDKKVENEERYNPPTKSELIKWKEVIDKYKEVEEFLENLDD